VDPSFPAAGTYRLSVVETADVSPRIRRVTLAGESLARFAALPGQDVVVHLIADSGAAVRRRYTIRNFDPDARRFDLDFVVHGHGPGSAWATKVRVGDDVEVFGPRGKVALSDAGWQLFAGDESALPAVAEMAAALPPAVSGIAFIEVADPAERQPVEAAALDVRWLCRNGAAAGTPERFEAALTGVDAPDSDRHAYLFGESRVVRRLRDLLGSRGWAAAEISAKGYWNVGRAARD